MRYLDPESGLSRRAVPNYEPRPPDARPRRGFPHSHSTPHQTFNSGGGDRWQRGPGVGRPAFDKSDLDKDLDRYGTKRQKERQGDGDGVRRDYDDWRAGQKRSRSRSRSRSRNRSRERPRVARRDRSKSGEGDEKDVRVSQRGPERRRASPKVEAEMAKRGRSLERSPSIRPDSPLRGDQSDGSGSDMVMEEDD